MDNPFLPALVVSVALKSHQGEALDVGDNVGENVERFCPLLPIHSKIKDKSFFITLKSEKAR